MAHGISEGVALKKKYGQHFLRDETVVHNITSYVDLTPQTSVFEIGCGDGFLTRAILANDLERLWVFEIDPEWVAHVNKTIDDKRLTVFEENFLDIDFTRLEPNVPWTVLANLPYQVTFPILYRFVQHKALLHEGVVMVQEEVAQKIVKKSGRGYGYASLFLQHHFDWELRDKVPPSAFYPPPKIFSRLLYFKSKKTPVIPDEQAFWKFIKTCFKQPRRTLRNNLEQTHFDLSRISDETFKLRAQQMSMSDLLQIWNLIRGS